MCHNAWQRPRHVGHMACHVSTCMAHLKAIYGVVRTSKEGQEGRGREKRKGGKEKRNGGKENRKGGKKRKGKKKIEEKRGRKKMKRRKCETPRKSNFLEKG